MERLLKVEQLGGLVHVVLQGRLETLRGGFSEQGVLRTEGLGGERRREEITPCTKIQRIKNLFEMFLNLPILPILQDKLPQSNQRFFFDKLYTIVYFWGGQFENYTATIYVHGR